MVVDNDTLLTQKQERAIIALLNEPSIPRAANAADIAERTMYRWKKLQPFISEYRARRREAFGQAIALTQRYATLAVTTLVRVMSGRCRASGSVPRPRCSSSGVTGSSWTTWPRASCSIRWT